MAVAKGWRLATLVLAVLLALVLASSAVYLSRMKRGYGEFTANLAKGEAIELKPSPIPEAWLIAGKPVCHANVFATAHDASSTGGMWGCVGPATFKWHYDGDETIYILEGFAEIEYLGKKFTLRAGERTHFKDGTTAVWHVPERVRKTWRIYEVGRVGKLVRSIIH